MKYWLAQQIKTHIKNEDGTEAFVTEVIGIFDSQERADKACTGEWDFVMPLNLNEVAPRETVVASEGYYPNDEDSDS